MQLTQIHIYPIKSLGGISLQEAVVEPRGLRYDRRWMLVDAEGRFMSQREIPEMALLRTAITPTFLEVFHKDRPDDRLQIPLEIQPDAYPKIMVEVWSDRCAARLLEEHLHAWFSRVLQQPLRLVYMPDTTRRRADGRYAPAGQVVSFADGFPFLLIGEASLADLNSRLEQTVPMDRFRPNLVFAGADAFEEDQWTDFTIQDQPFRCVKPCARCVMITADQETAARHAEPLKTLATYRKKGNKVLFGQNVIWLGKKNAMIRVGDRMAQSAR
ncbi:MAG: MOSC domain-containing protein [Saprospiraceae bacterium]|nr:MOSC domain-containing protein [Saprospiraceae bacterium]